MTHPIRKAHAKINEVKIDGESVVLALDSGHFYSLDGTAQDAWGLIDGIRDIPEIVTTLAEKYEIVPELLSVEIRTFIDDLVRAGLVEHD